MDTKSSVADPLHPVQYDQATGPGEPGRNGSILMPMEGPPPVPAGGTTAGSAFLYSPSGKAVSISIEFDIIDRLNFDIMKGYGAVPKRGAEVGGILLGTAEQGDRLVIRIEDFVTVPCEHLRGPSYILSENDMAGFRQTIEQWAPAPDKRIRVVGYFRSNTRNEFKLGAEDRKLLDAHFPAPAICLLVRPYATRIGEAAYCWTESGTLPDEPNGEVFPFRRKELGGAPRPKRAPAQGPASPSELPYDTGFSAHDDSQAHHGGLAGSAMASAIIDSIAPTLGAGGDRSAAAEASESAESAAEPLRKPENARKSQPSWVWIPLSFVFLLLGVVLGFQISMSFNKPAAPAKQADPYNLGVSVARSGDSLHVKWNLNAPAVQKARRAVLVIFDGDSRKTVDLGLDDLARGGVLYRNHASTVRFRLEIFHSDTGSIVESAEIKLVAGE